METSKSMIYRMLSKMTWWKERADQPTRSMMKNFGYPSQPTSTFPDAITEEMSRDFYAGLLCICGQHMLSALPMVRRRTPPSLHPLTQKYKLNLLKLPVLINGWENSSEVHRCCFILGTMSDVAFNIYDSVNSFIRTFLHSKFGRAPLVSLFDFACLSSALL